MTDKDIETAVAQMQQVLEREYSRLEWRVMVSPTPPDGTANEPWVFVHARTRDFRYRCRVGRPWALVQGARSLRRLVADLAAQAEQRLADQVAAAP